MKTEQPPTAEPLVSTDVSTDWFGGALALLICADGEDRIRNGRVLRCADDARGYSASAVVWLRDPTPEERAVVLPCLMIVPGVEMRAHPPNH